MFSFASQVLEDDAHVAISKRERERLKAQEKFRREQVEKMREQLNQEAAAGDVSKERERERERER